MRLRRYFEGQYYKHQIGCTTLAFIAGRTQDHSFIQVISNGFSGYFSYPLQKYYQCGRFPSKTVRIGNCIFSEKGVHIDISRNNVSISGKISYRGLTPIKYDIMGPFCLLPMQCRHSITSMHHKLDGHILIQGNKMDFTGGTGYIEGDMGSSFPSSYTWIQCNSFPDKCSITASVAHIPMLGHSFQGCICAIHENGKEYRLATYLGARILAHTPKQLCLQQGRHRLEIIWRSDGGNALIAPDGGKMIRTIREMAATPARFCFYQDGSLLFDRSSMGASVEQSGLPI